jgi:hypothetical protein
MQPAEVGVVLNFQTGTVVSLEGATVELIVRNPSNGILSTYACAVNPSAIPPVAPVSYTTLGTEFPSPGQYPCQISATFPGVGGSFFKSKAFLIPVYTDP